MLVYRRVTQILPWWSVFVWLDRLVSSHDHLGNSMKHHLSMKDFSLTKTSNIYFSIAMFEYQRVFDISILLLIGWSAQEKEA